MIIFLFALLILVGAIMTVVGYAFKTEGDGENSLFIAGLTLTALFSFGLGVIIASKGGFKVKHPVKPSVEVLIKDGKADTTYIYKFEEK